MKTVTGFVSVRKCSFSPEFAVTPWNATSYGGGGGGGEDDGDDGNDDNDDDKNHNNFVIDVIDVDKSLMVLLHYSILFFCHLPFELNIHIFLIEFIGLFLTERSRTRHYCSGCERLSLTYDEVSRV